MALQCYAEICRSIGQSSTAPFNKIGTLNFKAKPTNAFFATVNQMFGGFSQLSTTAERAVPYLRTMLLSKKSHDTKQCSDKSKDGRSRRTFE